MSDKALKNKRDAGTSGRSCLICGSMKSNSKLRLFRFPKSSKRRAEWLKSLEMTEAELKGSHRICNQHFHEGDLTKVPMRQVVNRILQVNEGDEMDCSSVQESHAQIDLDTTSDSGSEGSESPATVVHDEPGLDSHSTPELPNTSQDNVKWKISSVAGAAVNVVPSKNPEKNKRVVSGNKITVVHESSEGERLLIPVLVVPQGDSKNQQFPRISHSSVVPMKQFRYFEDFKASDLDTIRNKERCLDLGKTQIKKYRTKIQSLYMSNRRMEQQLNRFKETVSTLRQSGLISECAAETFKLGSGRRRRSRASPPLDCSE